MPPNLERLLKREKLILKMATSIPKRQFWPNNEKFPKHPQIACSPMCCTLLVIFYWQYLKYRAYSKVLPCKSKYLPWRIFNLIFVPVLDKLPISQNISEYILIWIQKWTNLNMKFLFSNSECWKTEKLMITTTLPESSNDFLRRTIIHFEMLNRREG